MPLTSTERLAEVLWEIAVAVYKSRDLTADEKRPSAMPDKFKSVPLMFRSLGRFARLIQAITGSPVAAFPQFTIELPGDLFGCVFVSGDGVTWGTSTGITTKDVGRSMRTAYDQRPKGTPAAFATFLGRRVVRLGSKAAEWHDVPYTRLGLPLTLGICEGWYWDEDWHPPAPGVLCVDMYELENDAARILQANRYAKSVGFRAGLPNFHKNRYANKGLVYGVMCVKSERAVNIRLHWQILDAFGSDYDFMPLTRFLPPLDAGSFNLTNPKRKEMLRRLGKNLALPGAT